MRGKKYAELWNDAVNFVKEQIVSQSSSLEAAVGDHHGSLPRPPRLMECVDISSLQAVDRLVICSGRAATVRVI